MSDDDDGRRADRRLLLAIAGVLLFGAGMLAFSIWLVLGPHFGRRGAPLIVLALGFLAIVVGSEELIHRLRHGRQRPGRRVRRD